MTRKLVSKRSVMFTGVGHRGLTSSLLITLAMLNPGYTQVWLVCHSSQGAGLVFFGLLVAGVVSV